MLNESAPYRALLRRQHGVISRAQCVSLGVAAATVDNQLRTGRWQRVQRGVYATFTGSLSREQQLWAALLRAGPGATFSHETAAELQGLDDRPSSTIHLTVPANRQPARYASIPGAVIHRSNALARSRHPTRTPPRTRVEDTVLDLIEASANFADAYTWICRAIGRRRTTAARIRAALDRRAKFPRRREVELALADAGSGALSWLELMYVRGVERQHGLPTATRQARVRQLADNGHQAGNRYLDNLYEEFRLCVEIDGTAAHPADEQWRDKRRDRRNLVYGKTGTLRFGYLDLRDQRAQCEAAAEIAIALTDRAPEHGAASAIGHPCGRPGCPVGSESRPCPGAA